jgi:rhodanese-related sulfurtransferase
VAHKLPGTFAILLLVVSLSAAACGADLEETSFERVDVTMFAQLIAQAKGDSDVVLLDLRTAEEVARGFIQDASHLDALDEGFTSQLEELNPDDHYLVYGRSNSSTEEAVRSMKALGFTHITALNGGMVEWVAQHRPVSLP